MVELRQKIENQLNQLSPEKLTLISGFLDSIQTLESRDLSLLQKLPPLKRGKKVKDLLKNIEKWQGNDLEECLNIVYETRSKTQF